MSTSSRPKVPDGLRDLMKDLTREILKEKPIDIYEFAGNYFQTRLPQKEDYAVRDFEPNTKRYDFSYIQNPQRYQVPVALVYSIVPEGLTNLIKDLIKAILREQPQNLCDFAVEYFRHLKTATQEVEKNEISYKAYDNYFTNKERFLFTPYVKCTCGRTFGEGFGSSMYQLDNLSTIQHNHRNDSSYKTETITTSLEDTNNNHVKAGQVNDSIHSEKYINAIYVIQRYFRRYLKRTKGNNLSTSTHSITQNNCMTEETAAIIIQRTLKNFFGRDRKATDKQLSPQNNEIVSVVPHLQINPNENDNISEAASYTSASTALLSASESGRETSEMSASDNILRKIIVKKEEIENISNILTTPEVMPIEGVTHVDANHEDEGGTVSIATKKLETIVYNQELTESLETQNTVSNMDNGALMGIDLKNDESLSHGVNNESGQQKEENKTNSFNNITNNTNDTKKYNEPQMETENNKILQVYKQIGSSLESGYNHSENEQSQNKSNEDDVQQKDKAEIIKSISSHKLNNECVLDNSENPSMVNKSKEFTNKRDEAHEQGLDFEQQKLDSSHESLDDETHNSILKLNQEIIESCDEIQRKNLTNSIDENSNEYSNKNDIVNEVSLVKEADVIENRDELKTQHLENKAIVIDSSMEQLHEKTKTALEENESYSNSQTIEDMNDLKNKHIRNSQSKENLNEPETNLVMQQLLYVEPNEIKNTILTTIINNADGDGVIGGKTFLEKSTEQTIESAEFLLKSDSEKQNVSNSLIHEINSNEFPLESDSSKEKEEDSNFCQPDVHSTDVELKQAELEINDNRSATENDKLILNKTPLDFPENKSSKSNSSEGPTRNSSNHEQEFGEQNRTENKLMKDLENNHDFVDELNETIKNQDDKNIQIEKLVALQPLPNKSIDNDTKNDSSYNTFEIESNHRNNKGNVALTEPDVSALMATESNATQNKTNDDNILSYNPDKYEVETESEQINPFQIVRENCDENSKNKSTIDIENRKEQLINEKQSNYQIELNNITEYKESFDTESKSENHPEPILNKFEQQQGKPTENEFNQEDIAKNVMNVLAKPDQTYKIPTEKSAESSNEHELLQAIELQDTNQTSNYNKINLDEEDKKSIQKPNDEDITKINRDGIDNISISNEDTIMIEDELPSDNQKESDSQEQIYIKETKLDRLKDEDVPMLRETSWETETSKDDNNKSISNEATILEDKLMKPNDQKEVNSHKQIHIRGKELDKPYDEDITQPRASCKYTETRKDGKNNKNICNEATIVKDNVFQSDKQKASDSHEQMDIKVNELDKLNDETSKTEETNKPIPYEATTMKGEELQTNDQKDSDSREQIDVKDNELSQLNDEDSTTETIKNDTNNKYINNEATIVKANVIQSDKPKASDSHEQMDIKVNELDNLNDETSKTEENNTPIPYEATTMKGVELQPKDKNDSREQIDTKDKELGQLNEKDATTATKTSNDDTNNQYIYNEAAILEGDELQPGSQKESDSQPKMYINDKPNADVTTTSCTSTETSNEDQKKTESLEQTEIKEKEHDKINDVDITTSYTTNDTSNDDKNNKYISKEAAITKEEELQPDTPKESEYLEQLDITDKELNKHNDDDTIHSRTTTETCNDDKNNKYILNEATIMAEEDLQPDNQKELGSREQIDIKDKELDKRKEEDIITATETNKDTTNNKYISNEAKGEELQKNDQKEYDSHEQIDTKGKELGKIKDEDKTTSCTTTETSKDDTNNEYISNEATMEEEKQQPDCQIESDSHGVNINDKELDKLNDKDITTATEASKDATNNKYMSNAFTLINEEELQTDDQKESDSREKIDITDIESDKLNYENITKSYTTTETIKDHTNNNKYISNEGTLTKGEELQKNDQKESVYHEQIDIEGKELDKINEEDLTTTSEDDKKNEYIANEATIMEGENQQPDGQIKSDSHEIDVIHKKLDKLNDEDIPKSFTSIEMSNDNKNNKYISNEGTLIKGEELQQIDQKETESHKQMNSKDKALEKLIDEDTKTATVTSQDHTNSKYISNEAIFVEEEDNQQPDRRKESDSHEKMDKLNYEDITKLRATPCCEIENSNDGKYKNSIFPEATNVKAVELPQDDQKGTNSLNQIDMTKSKNADECNKQETLVNVLDINKDLIIPNQIEIQEKQNNESTAKELINSTDFNSKEAQEDQQKPKIDTNDVAILESGEKMEKKSIAKDGFEKDKQDDSEVSSSVCGTEPDKQKLTSTEKNSNEDEVMKLEQITRTDQSEKLENKSLESYKENPLKKQDELKAQEYKSNANLNEAVDLKREQLDLQNNEHSVSSLNETGVLMNEENKNTHDDNGKYKNFQTTKINNEQLHESFNEETSATKSCNDESDLDHQNKVVLNSTDYEKLELKADNKKEDNETTIEKPNANTDNEKPDSTIDQTQNVDMAKTTSIENIRDDDDGHLEIKDNIQENNKANIPFLGAQSEKSNDDKVSTPNMLLSLPKQETCEGDIPNQENIKIDNNESILKSNEHVNTNSETDIDDTVHRILTERLKELRIQNEQNVLRKHHSEKNIDCSLENDIKQHERTESDVNSNIKAVTNNILYTPNQEANEKSLIVAESETHLFEKKGDTNEELNVSPNELKIEQDFAPDHSENMNRIRRSLSQNEENNVNLNVENVESLDNDKKIHAENEDKMPQNEISVKRSENTKRGLDQEENEDVFNDKTIENVVGSENENDQETTLDNIGNKSPETLIGNQNLNIGRIRNYNEGLIESISGQRFAETHLKSFWKEYQMNNGKPLDQYDCGGNEKVLTIKEQALTEKDDRSLKANFEMINHTSEKTNENEYVLIKTESNCFNEVKHLDSVDSMVNQENYPVESSNNQNISQGIEDSNAHYNDINHNKNVERIPRYFHGSIPIVAKHNLLEKRKAVKEPTSFTIPFAKSAKLKNDGKSSTIKAFSPESTTNKDNIPETDQMIYNKEINLDNCADVEPLLDSETPTKLFSELNEFDYDETHDIDLEITYTIDEILRLKAEHDSQKNSDEESEFEMNEYSPIIIRLTAKNESQPVSDDSEETIIDQSELSPTPESMLHTIVELSESETPRPDSKSMISSPALLQRNDEDFLTNLEKISNSTSTSWTTGSKEGEDYSFVSDEFLEDENYHKDKSPTKTITTETQGGIYEYTKGKTSEEVQTDINKYDDLIKQAPSPPTVDPFYEDEIEKAANKIQTSYREYLRRKKEVSTENNEYSDEIINGKRSLLMAVYTIQRAFRSYQLRKNHTVHINSDTISKAQPELATTDNEDEYSKEIASAGQSFLNSVCIIQRAFRKYKLRKEHMNENCSSMNTHESKQFADHSKNNMAANVIQKAFRQYLDHKLIMNNEQDSNVMPKSNSANSPDKHVKDDKKENVDNIMPDNLQLTENVRLKEISNTIKETKQNSIANDEESIYDSSESNLSRNTTDSQKTLNASPIKNENIIKLNMLIGQFIDSERQYSNAVNQQKALKSTIVLAEPIINQSVSQTDFEGEMKLNNNIVEIMKSSQITTNNENYLFENPKNINNNPTQSNAIETVIDKKNDLVENPSNDTIENMNRNEETEKNNNSENQISETVDKGNDYFTPSETDCDVLENPSENHHNSLSPNEPPSQELAATIIQRAFRSYLQIKNKPHELELFSNEVGYFEPTAPKEDDLNSYSSSTLNSTSSFRTTEEQAARVIQKALRKFMHRKAEHQQLDDDSSSDQTTKWFVGDEPIIPNESLLRSPSEISFDETEAYVELNDSPQYSVDLCSNLDKNEANNLSRSPTAPVSYRSSSSVDLSNINQKTNLSEETVSVVGTGIQAVQLMNKNQEQMDVAKKELSENGKSLNQFPETNLVSNKNVEIAKLQNITGEFINSERQYSDDVNQSNPSIPKADITDMHIDFVDSQKEFSETKIPYEELEEPCIKKTLSKSLITTDSNDETINAEELSTSSDVDNDTEDSLSMKTVKLHESEEAIEKMKQRRDSTTKISNLEKPKDYSFDEPLVEPIDNLDTDEDGIVVCKFKREETLESSAQSEEDVVIGKESHTLDYYGSIDFDTQFPAKGSLKRVHTIAGDSDAKSLLKNVTIDESIKYIEPPDFEVNSGSFCLDDATSQNIRRNMMAYSLSEADSDCFDKNLNNLNNSSLESKSQKYDDFNVSTALIDNGDTSTETESTIVSAVTKIQAGARGYLTRKRLGRTSNTSDHKSMTQNENSKASFGNAAISESLEHLVQEAAAKRIQKVYRKHYRQKLAEINQQNEITSPELTTSMESSLAQKRSIMLQRGDALRNDSTPDEGNSSSNGSDDQKAKIKITDESKAKLVNKQQTEVKSIDENQSLAQAKMTAAAIRANKIEENKKRWLAMRQNSMPVQIDSEVLRVIPKHMRKKIKSAEGEKKGNGRRRVLKKD